ncbi:MAG TPA: hypothetical protein VIB07_05470 [Nitrososphaera sp.]
MYNKGSCRNCGTSQKPLSICIMCKEDVSWLCDNCGRADDATHNHLSTHIIHSNA